MCALTWGNQHRSIQRKIPSKLESERFFHVHTWLRCRLAKGRHSSTSFQVSQVRFGARDYHLGRSCICCNRQPMAKCQWTSNVSRLILPYQASGCSLVVRTCRIRDTIQEKRDTTTAKLHQLAALQTTLSCPCIYFLLLLKFALPRTEFCIGHWRGSTQSHPTKSNPRRTLRTAETSIGSPNDVPVPCAS